ncbi:membrane protein [Corynebacterium phocae]|uniref:Membrane protein n=1 Tax=Corynebacterium phocae TaxID=161895 RepID=A0A1L7D5H8_9CORY|nr:FUSC family protein [Corynebacterium phocae]APT93327.1 membrane protein [Corynebacterium phocae]KAA8721660.1 aromatic acid exporter family protein [Corynebacterium phocae]
MGIEKNSVRQTTRETLRTFDKSLKARLRRVNSRWVFILHATLGAGLAFYVAHVLFGHEQPFFAPMSVIIILGLSGSDRLTRAIELSVGGIVGVVVGTLLVDWLGTGPIHLTITIGIALLVALFLTDSQLISNQIAVGAILIATILPPENMGGQSRVIDALVGAVIGVAMMALIPTSPLRAGRVEVSKVLHLAGSVLSDVAYGLREGKPEAIRDARRAVQGSQENINAMLTAAKGGKETARVSPFLWATQRHIRSLERILMPVDNAVRGVRVLARRALVSSLDKDRISEVQIQLIEELADISRLLGELYGQSSKQRRLEESRVIPEAIHRLRAVGAKAGMDIVEQPPVLSSYAILAQTRSIVVDLLMVCGMSNESAVASLVPTSSHPAFPPEVHPD